MTKFPVFNRDCPECKKQTKQELRSDPAAENKREQKWWVCLKCMLDFDFDVTASQPKE